MSRTKGAENLSEFSVYFYLLDGDEVCVTVKANSSVSACMQVIQDFNPVRISKVYKFCPLPSIISWC